ncbi:hypothetical protein NTGZN8_290015 [Candidatus Nitrotoga fabula]|uniref:Uncharacterized protein n=1 Tax=Candidatus Nitrotoga fabula TaxID=2182327 RepID=A0A916BCF3_9PROT|nr:hypothetical protein NTGZN8_290015 [Candidatus Nitrotoga fabula]
MVSCVRPLRPNIRQNLSDEVWITTGNEFLLVPLVVAYRCEFFSFSSSGWSAA